MHKFKAGDYVKFDALRGSIGRVEEVSESAFHDTCYVRWTFGRDVHGEEISSSLSACREAELISITKERYEKARDGEAFKGE